MNHYERLKVTQDAPPEVIRAAYRALAQMVPSDEDREARLIELNTAYEALIDPEIRQAYDTVQAVAVPDIVVDEESGLDITLDALALSPQALSPDAPSGAVDNAAPSDPDMVDPWQAAYEASAYQPPKHWSRQPAVWLGGALVLLMTVLAGVGLWQMQKANQLAQGLVVQLGEAASGVVTTPVSPRGVPPAGAASGVLSVEELSRLSDEELLAVLPKLGEVAPSGSLRDQPSVATQRPIRGGTAARHPLDGTPLNLRTEGELVDPLAPEAASKPAVRAR